MTIGFNARGAAIEDFQFPALERVFTGAGSLAMIAAELDRHGRKRAILVTGKSLGESPLLKRVEAAVGSRLVRVFTQARQHVPASTVQALVDAAKGVSADTIISFGGGSPIDSAKVAAASILNGRDMIADAGELDFTTAFGHTSEADAVIHIAIPTTLSAAEYTAVGGVTTGTVKKAIVDARTQPRAVINDAELTLATPDWLWVSTGMRALDHAVEAIYSRRHQTFTDTIAAQAIRLLIEHLPGSVRATGDDKLMHRSRCQLAAWFSIYGSMNTGFGISHSLGHQIGPAWNVPHGFNSCITLPHAMRFMAEERPDLFGPIAGSLGITFDPSDPQPAAIKCADRVAQFIADFDVPHSLKDLGIKREEIGRVAHAVYEELKVFPVTERPTSLDDVNGLLAASWQGY
jgi:alcohol dehydrogenase class IV